MRRHRFRFVTVILALAMPPQLLALLDLSRALSAGGHAAVAAALPWAMLACNLPLLVVFARRRIPKGALGEVLLVPFSVSGIGSLVYLPLAAVLHGAHALGAPMPAWWVFASPFALIAYGAFIGQRWMRPERVEVPVEGLPESLRGLKLVHLSDLHLGGFVSDARLRRIARHAAKLGGDAVVVTGDIVDRDASHARRAGEILASIPAPLGVYACLGNHDHYAGARKVAADLTAAGVTVLMNRGARLGRGGNSIWLCGIDDISFGGHDLDAALAGRPAGMPAVLLSHNPNFFPVAARAGVALTLSGHTHGGQFGVLWLHRALSLARLITRYVAGLYNIGASHLYVSRGAGLVMPLRVGARPEVTLLELVPAQTPHEAAEPVVA